MKPTVSLRQALDDPQLLGHALVGESWAIWRVVLLASMGEPLNEKERAIFEQVTGRAEPPCERVEEFWGIIGRRGGKDVAASVLSAYLAGLGDWTGVTAPGEIPTVVCIAPDQRQARIQLSYITGVLKNSIVLSGLIQNETSDSLELSNGVVIDVRAASFRRIRGVTAVAVIASEAAFWYSDEASSNTDSEILNAIRPALATTSGPLIVITSPYAQRGEVFETYRRHYGPNGDQLILVAHGASRTFNPTLPQRVVDRAMERDPASASAEYLAQFRTDIADYVTRAAVEACIERGVIERKHNAAVQFSAFVDPSGGASDSMTLAIGHTEKDTIVIDVLREVPAPFNPESATAEFVSVLKHYRIRGVTGDRYAGQWCQQSFERQGIKYEPSDTPKSGLYLDLLPKINSGTIRLLDHPKSINQLCSLERRTARGGRDSIDHRPGAHDDIANVIAGVASVLVQPKLQGGWGTYHLGYGTPPKRPYKRSWSRQPGISAVD